MNRLRRTGLTLALALGLSLATAGVSAASPEAAPGQKASASTRAAVICPGQGQRVKKENEGRVYVVARGYILYWIPNSTVYFDLWGSWDGVVTLPKDTFDACFTNPSRPLNNGHLVKEHDNDAVYIWDGSYGKYRQIASWWTFTEKYHFDPAEIDVKPDILQSSVDLNNPWT
ncbi:hypothetical protein [Streptomyces muensis]|uniref:Secreted protein n=1 Tax=Streptomyces muensis TaxID=1077944 RepID=A0A9X1TR59_STRM4|nr:hypothetical protein [Streptomyces muensis]MCF1599514.1 hypothetical protein [Streptomyces muensis]